MRPEIQRDGRKDLGGFSVIHVEFGPWWTWNEMPVQHEIDETNASAGFSLLRMDTLENAIERGRAFFVVELRPRDMPEAAAREWLELQIAALRSNGARASARFDVRSIFAAEVRADGPLPNPMMSYAAQAWACLPGTTGSPGTGQERHNFGPAARDASQLRGSDGPPRDDARQPRSQLGLKCEHF